MIVLIIMPFLISIRCVRIYENVLECLPRALVLNVLWVI